MRGGRGSGKTRTGSETLAGWILEHEPGEWAAIAPTFGDARSVCAEGESGLLRSLGAAVSNWNRSEGVIYVANGAKVYLDGADDGALRIQGKNLRGAWCDEVGLWRDWDRAWNQSLAFAVRLAPGRLIATGTPKMGHPLVALLLANSQTHETRMRTLDNAANLDAQAVAALLAEYEGTTLGRQELEGEFIAALEGEILRRADWRYYPRQWSFYADDGQADYMRLPRFTQVVHSWDPSGKGKDRSDFVSGQVWGVEGANRWLLRLWHGKAGLEQLKHEIQTLAEWARGVWDYCPHRVLVEASQTGPDAVTELRGSVEGLNAIAVKGDKVQRAWAASPALESHNCLLPGQATLDTTSYDGSVTPSLVQGFVEECAMFRADEKHAYDDQVDAWSQMVNWTRRAGPYRSSMTVAEGTI